MSEQPRTRSKVRRVLRALLILIVLIVCVPLSLVHWGFAASLPKLDGSVSVPGLNAPVSISRDALGIPTIEAANRVDLAFGTGYVHAQDRFFQMDLSRRLAAGELSELFGRVALEQDRSARLFRFRALARRIVEQAPPEQRALIEAYAHGVNAGLASLRSRPWEYWVLDARPVAWRPEDTALVPYAMWWDLQHNDIAAAKLKRAINERLGGALCANGWKCALGFFYPHGTSWDAPNPTGATVAPAAPIRIPSPEELNVRARAVSADSSNGGRSNISGSDGQPVDPSQRPLPAHQPIEPRSPPRPAPVGSNAWAVAGKLSSSGAALVSSDMHLGLRVPATWYRARLKITQAQGALDLNGLTLPGAPVLVAGSNGKIAWGFTNAYGKWADVTLVPCIAGADGSLAILNEGSVRNGRSAAGEGALFTLPEPIRVKGQEDADPFRVRFGNAGVLFDVDAKHGRCWFVHWLAAREQSTNFNILRLETASSVSEAVALAPTIGIPHQNLIVGDRQGHIAWSIIGRVPANDAAPMVPLPLEPAGGTATRSTPRKGNASSRNAPQDSGTPVVLEQHRFEGTDWTTADTHPKLIDPPSGRVWTANARPIDDGTAEKLIGGDEADTGARYDLGARAGMIRDALAALKTRATPADMLRIQLDDRAVFLERWQELLLRLLDEDAVRGHAQRAAFRQVVANWRARASADSVGYRLVRAFHTHVERAVWDAMLAALDIDATGAPPPMQFEGAVWELVTQQPLHMLASTFPNWHEFLLAQADAAIADLATKCPQLERCAWGARLPVSVRHPLSRALPFAVGLLDMPTLELPGDHEMPRVQDGAFGASERFSVSPGHETEGYLHIAGGQSGHPLSPYYRAGFRDWAEGKAAPFLPGRAEHELRLVPGTP